MPAFARNAVKGGPCSRFLERQSCGNVVLGDAHWLGSRIFSCVACKITDCTTAVGGCCDHACERSSGACNTQWVDPRPPFCVRRLAVHA